MYSIPLTETTLDEEEVEAACAVLRSKWLTMGEQVSAFETEFAHAIGTRHAIAVANGTVALEIVYTAMGLSAGDEIILPAITFVACFNAAVRLGLRPTLADCVSENDLTISLADAGRLATPRTRAIVTMPHAGFPPAMAGFANLARDRGIHLIEDACHAPLASIDGRNIGSFGGAAAWSFFGNKNMTTGEGGMVTTDDDAVAERLKLLRSHGITRTTWDRSRGHAWDYDVALAGTNARMDEIRAAIGRVQLRKLAAANAARRRAAGLLRERLSGLLDAGLTIPFDGHPGESSNHLFLVLLPPGTPRAKVMESMAADGIQTSIHYPPLDHFTNTSRYFAEHGGAEGLPVARRVADRIVTLPLGPSLTAEQIDRIAASLARSLQGR